MEKKKIIKFTFYILFAIGFIFLYFYICLSTKEQRDLEKKIQNITVKYNTRIKTSIIAEDCTYYFILAQDKSELPESFFDSIYSLYAIQNPVIYVILNTDDKTVSGITTFINNYFINKTPSTTSSDNILKYSDNILYEYNLNNSKKLIMYPLKYSELYENALMDVKQREEEQIQFEKEQEYHLSKVLSENYLKRSEKNEIYNTGIKGVKNYNKSETITVVTVHAKCSKDENFVKLIGDIKNIEKTPYLRIYIYGEDTISYKNEKPITTWFFDKNN